jgi:hypothetical protein
MAAAVFACEQLGAWWSAVGWLRGLETWTSQVRPAPRAGGAPEHHFLALCRFWQRGNSLFRRAWTSGPPEGYSNRVIGTSGENTFIPGSKGHV